MEDFSNTTSLPLFQYNYITILGYIILWYLHIMTRSTIKNICHLRCQHSLQDCCLSGVRSEPAGGRRNIQEWGLICGRWGRLATG